MADLEKLKTVSLLSPLSDEELKDFTAACETVSTQQGGVIFNEDDPGDTLYVLISGRVQIAKHILENQEEVLSVVFGGDIFGEMAFIDGTARSSTAKALDDCEMLVMKREKFDKLFNDRPEMSFKIMEQLSQTLTSRLRVNNEKIKQGILWNLDISGATALSIQHLISSNVGIEVELNNGKKLSGFMLLVVNTEVGWQVTVKDQEGRLYIIPYGAINYISVREDDFKQTLKG